MPFIYAELNAENVCIGIKSVFEEMTLPNHILIDTYDMEYLWKKYENEQWSEEQFLPDVGAIQLTRMEQLEKRNAELERSQSDQDELLMQLMLTTGGN